MNSSERHEHRYQRRKEKREKNKLLRNEQLGSLEEIFSYSTLFRAGEKCCRGVRWKRSVNNFELHLISGTALRRHEIINGTWKGHKGSHFMLAERGKIRPIDAPTVQDRQVHKVITENILYPLYRPQMIYDNGASQQGKGLSFSFMRLKTHLHRWYRKHGRDGFIVLIDLRKFFPSAPHWAIYNRHQDMIQDGRIRNLCDQVVMDFARTSGSSIGMPLGVEPSQAEMVALPSIVDNYVKCQLGVKEFAHYMDDYYAIFETKEQAQAFIEDIHDRFQNKGLQINRNKCKIIPLTSKFKYCKATFFLTDTGKVVCRGNRDSLKRTRHKMHFFVRQLKEGKMTKDKVAEWYNASIRGYYMSYNDHNRVLKLNRLYYNIIGGTVCSKSSKTEPKSA